MHEAMDKKAHDEYVKILEHELVPALGCTEPGAVAFAAASAAAQLGREPERLLMRLSGSVIKNVHSVTVPNAQKLKGVNSVAILGALIGTPEKKLCILEAVTPEQVERTEKLLETDFCVCELAKNVDELYIQATAYAGENSAEVTVAGGHTCVVSVKKDGRLLLAGEQEETRHQPDKSFLTVRGILDFADKCEIEAIAPILQRQINANSAIAKEGMSRKHGVCIGQTLLKMYGSEDVRVRARAAAAAGSDARMDGCTLPVVINSGSGNQGITVCLPVVEYAKELHKSQEKLLRALALANLIAVLQKRTVGNLSAFCGAVHAAAGAACGIAYLQGGGYKDISNVITYTLATIGGMVCDGAKASCAAKINQALDTALMGLELSMREHRCFGCGDGLVKDNVENTIDSFGRMGKDGMKKTNEKVLEIMLEKSEPA